MRVWRIQIIGLATFCRRFAKRCFVLLRIGVFAMACQLALPSALPAQPSGTTSILPAWAQVRGTTPRRALVIGISDYDFLLQLPKSQTDAATVADKLRDLGFQVSAPANHVTRAELLQAIDAFDSTLREGDIALLYFSGHGVERNSTNYLIPSETHELVAGREGLLAVDAEFVVHELEARKVSVAVVILDACREDPFAAVGPIPGTPVQPKGLGPIQADASGVFIGYAAAPHQTAYGGLAGDPPDRPSVFTRYLADELTEPGRTLYWIWSRVGEQVFEATGHQQRPWQSASIFPELRLKPEANDQLEAEQAWVEMLQASSPLTLQGDLESYLRAFPDSPYAPAAVAKLVELRAAPRRANEPASSDAVAAQEPSSVELSGAVVPTPVVSSPSEANHVSAAAQLVLHETPSAQARAVSTVTAGGQLEALSKPNAEGWIAVRDLYSGIKGFIANVSTVDHASTGVELSYAPDSESLGSNNLERLQSILNGSQAASTRVTVEVGQPENTPPDRATTLSYLRALKLRSELVKAGIRAEQVQMRISGASDLVGDKVDLSITQLPGEHQ